MPSLAQPSDHSQLLHSPDPMAEQRTRWVMWLTLVMMVVELLAGWYTHSMALQADGWHMSSHLVAFGLTVLAYTLSRRLAADKRFAFGTWKIEVLGGYTSAIVLVGVAAYMAFESLLLLRKPAVIAYNQALVVAALGLLVNLICAWLLAGAHHHASESHSHGHLNDDDHDHHAATTRPTKAHHDLNLRSAYLHVAADAATSILAIVALLCGKYLGWVWLDPTMGLLGAVLVASWCVSLIRDTAMVLLDAEMDSPLVARIRQSISEAPAAITLEDLHLWRVGKNKFACLVSVSSTGILRADDVRQLLNYYPELVHVTVEVNSTPAH